MLPTNQLIKDIAAEFMISQKALRWMMSEQILSGTLDNNSDQVILGFVSKVLKSDGFVKILLASRSIKKRLNLAQSAGMSKPEAYIYSRYKNRTEAIQVKRLAFELHKYFGVPVDHQVRKMIQRIRKKVENERQYCRNKILK